MAKRKAHHWFGSFVRTVIVLAVLIIGLPSAAVWGVSRNHIFTTSTVPSKNVTLVLGAAMWSSGPSPYLQNRLDLAAELYKAGKTKVIIVSGTRDVGYNEPDGMKKALVAAGVPADKIVPDYGGNDTYSSCQRAHDVFGVTSLIVVTQSYHLPRAVASCRLLHIDAVGVGDDTVAHDARWRSYQVRELFGKVKLIYDVATQRAVASETPSDAVNEALQAG